MAGPPGAKHIPVRNITARQSIKLSEPSPRPAADIAEPTRMDPFERCSGPVLDHLVGGQQFVRVERVHVNDGGQAVIGNVERPDTQG